jgi:type I restriction enzyme M protein
VRLPNSVFKPYASIGTNLLFFEKGDADAGHLVLRAPRARGPESLFDDQADPVEHLQGCVDWWGGAAREGPQETPQAWKVSADEVKARGYNLDIKNPHTHKNVADDHGDPSSSSTRANARKSASFTCDWPFANDGANANWSASSKLPCSSAPYLTR